MSMNPPYKGLIILSELLYPCLLMSVYALDEQPTSVCFGMTWRTGAPNRRSSGVITHTLGVRLVLAIPELKWRMLDPTPVSISD